MDNSKHNLTKCGNQLIGRYFNTFKRTTNGFLNKSSENKQKILDEIYWYTNIPIEISSYAAEIIEFSIAANSANYSLKYYPYPQLASMFVNREISISSWKEIIIHLFILLNKFKTHPSKIDQKDFTFMYLNKTLNRLNELKGLSYWDELLKLRYIKINGIKYHNFFYFLKDIKKRIKTNLFLDSDMCIIHGDLCLSNILYNSKNSEFILLDPRGRWKEQSIYGDIKYDLAKLRHSFSDYYDFIIQDRYKIQEVRNGEFYYDFDTDKYHTDVSNYFNDILVYEGYNLEDISFIESQLFLSMIPLHLDDFNRQKVMYILGIKLLNDSFSSL